MLANAADDTEVLSDLRSFNCGRDADIAGFLHLQAIPFERAGKSKTYLLVHSDRNEIEIVAYFTVAISFMEISEKVSRNRRRKLNGIFENEIVPCYLIGQLAKDDDHLGDVTGNEILEAALTILQRAKVWVGGRVVRIDCRNEEKIIDFYLANGFSEIPTNGDDGLRCLVRLF
jgi:hypothetical protein